MRKHFPKARIVFKAGNHDERWDSYVWANASLLAGLDELRLPAMLKMEEHGIEYVADKRIIKAGLLTILHGHELPKGLASPVNPARGVFLRLGTPGLIGHGHRSSVHAQSNVDKDEVVCWSTGCLCGLHPLYAPINAWNLGFATIDVHSDGTYDVENLRIANGYKIRQS